MEGSPGLASLLLERLRPSSAWEGLPCLGRPFFASFLWLAQGPPRPRGACPRRVLPESSEGPGGQGPGWPCCGNDRQRTTLKVSGALRWRLPLLASAGGPAASSCTGPSASHLRFSVSCRSSVAMSNSSSPWPSSLWCGSHLLRWGWGFRGLVDNLESFDFPPGFGFLRLTWIRGL